MSGFKHPPKYCPNCGGINVDAVPLWRHSQWLADPQNPGWEPFHGTTYDTWCSDCKICFDISPGEEMDVYWYDEHPEDIPEGGNKIYTDVLLRRSYTEDSERCGNCIHFHSGFRNHKWIGIYCDLDKEKQIHYYSICLFNPSKFMVGGEHIIVDGICQLCGDEL